MHLQGRETSTDWRITHGRVAAALAVKSGFDRLVGAALLLVLAPALAVIALYARHMSSGPALVGSHRPGRDGNPFVLLRFDLPGPLAELPQMVNVARGELPLAQVYDLTERLAAGGRAAR